MIKDTFIKIVLSLSRMVAQSNPNLSAHHAQVAFLSQKIAQKMRLDQQSIQDIVIAASIHDIGLLSFSNREGCLVLEEEYPFTHSLTMFFLIEHIRCLNDPAQIIRYHHTHYNKLDKKKEGSKEIPLGSFIIRLADRTSVMVNPNIHILEQKSSILKLLRNKKHIFCPEVFASFEEIFDYDYIWLELASTHPEILLNKILQESIQNIPDLSFFALSEIIGHLVDFKSPFTAAHSYCVAQITNWLAERMQIPLECDYKNLFLIGFLHDIGKLSIPIEILEKTGKLDPIEWDIMRSHAYYSHVALELLYDSYPELMYAPLHHERLDGSGYPFGLKGEQISNCTLLISVGDIFTALTENRPYRRSMGQNEIAKILLETANYPGKKGKIHLDIIDFLLSNYKEAKEVRDESENKVRRKYNDFGFKIKSLKENEKQELLR